MRHNVAYFSVNTQIFDISVGKVFGAFLFFIEFLVGYGNGNIRYSRLICRKILFAKSVGITQSVVNLNFQSRNIV